MLNFKEEIIKSPVCDELIKDFDISSVLLNKVIISIL